MSARWPRYKCHASGLSDIMAKATAGRTIPVGAQTQLEIWMRDVLYGRKLPGASTSATRKGNITEDQSIEVVSELLGKMLFKNETTYENDWFIGTPDLVLPDMIIDVKSPFSHQTMPVLKVSDDTYFEQLQVYMDLTGSTKSAVIYVLNDMPEELLMKECYKMTQGEEVTEEIYEQVRELYTYSHLPLELRVKRFDYELDTSFISQAKERIDAMNLILNDVTKYPLAPL